MSEKIVYFNTEDLKEIVESFINGNRNDAVKSMNEIKELGQENEFLDMLDNYSEHKMEILEYFFKNS